MYVCKVGLLLPGCESARRRIGRLPDALKAPSFDLLPFSCELLDSIIALSGICGLFRLWLIVPNEVVGLTRRLFFPALLVARCEVPWPCCMDGLAKLADRACLVSTLLRVLLLLV